MTEKRMVSTGHWVAWAWCDPEQFLCHIVTVSAGCSQAIPLVPSVPPCGVRAVETMQGRFPTVSYITAEEATVIPMAAVSGTPRVHRKKRFQIEDEDD